MQKIIVPIRQLVSRSSKRKSAARSPKTTTKRRRNQKKRVKKGGSCDCVPHGAAPVEFERQLPPQINMQHNGAHEVSGGGLGFNATNLGAAYQTSGDGKHRGTLGDSTFLGSGNPETPWQHISDFFNGLPGTQTDFGNINLKYAEIQSDASSAKPTMPTMQDSSVIVNPIISGTAAPMSASVFGFADKVGQVNSAVQSTLLPPSHVGGGNRAGKKKPNMRKKLNSRKKLCSTKKLNLRTRARRNK